MAFLESLRRQRELEQAQKAARTSQETEMEARRLEEQEKTNAQQRETYEAFRAIRVAALGNSIVPQLALVLGELTGGIVDNQEDCIYIRYNDGFLRSWRGKTYEIGREIEIAGRDDAFINIGRKILSPDEANDLNTVDKALEDAYKHRRKTKKQVFGTTSVTDDWQ